MIHDSERREVARRLREIRPCKSGHIEWWEIARALGLKQPAGWFGWEKFEPDSANRLADLIEPSIPADPGEAGLASVDAFIRERTEKPVDRDALLELADEMENDTWYLSDFDHRMATSFAHRIREALKGES